jgi:hypothetical protein
MLLDGADVAVFRLALALRGLGSISGATPT